MTCDDVPVIVDTTLVHWLLNKPAGYVTTASDPHGRPTVLDLVPAEPRVFPVGRLDMDSEGLLLLTNDGDLAQLLMHPRHGVEKEYFVEVEGVPSPAALRRLREGVELDDGLDATGAGAARAGIRRRQQRARDRGEGRPQANGAAHVRRRSAIPCAGWCVHASVRCATSGSRPGTWRTLTLDEVRSLYAAALDERRPVPPGSLPPCDCWPCGAPRPATTTRKPRSTIATQELVREMLARNAISHDDLVSIIFTATNDLTAEFPATAARALGLGDVPLICAR